MRAPIVEKPGKRRPETEIREELEALHIQGQAVMQHRSLRWYQDAEEGLSPHTSLHRAVARVPDVAKVRSLTDLCGLQIKV
jgi:hypothetical protein